MEYWVKIKGNSLPVTVSFKEMKTVRLKVFPTRIIKLSVPLDTPETWISEYLINKTPWIEKKIELFAQTRAIEKEEHFISGSTTRILGQQLMIQVRESPKKFIIQEDSVLFVFTPETDQQKIDAQINNWWQHTAKQHFQEVVDRLYHIIGKYGIKLPSVCVKKMTTLWGSCSRKSNKINLNFYLYKASVPCVEYVILHELAHFLYPYHNKDFYDFLTIHMPDWQDRKKQLDYEFVLGI